MARAVFSYGIACNGKRLFEERKEFRVAAPQLSECIDSSDFVTGIACNGKRLFEECKEFRVAAPQLSECIDNLAERKRLSQYCYNFLSYIVVCVTILAEASQRTFEAGKTLIDANQAKRNVENKIKKILELLEDMHCEAKTNNRQIQTNPADNKKKSFPTAEKKLRSLLSELKTELDKLYDDIMDQIIHYTVKKENASFLKGLVEIAIVMVVGTGLAVKNPDVSALTISGAIAIGFATCLNFVAWKKYSGDQNNNNEEPITRLSAAKTQVLEAKIIVQKFLTELELLEIKGGYTENDLNRIIQTMYG